MRKALASCSSLSQRTELRKRGILHRDAIGRQGKAYLILGSVTKTGWGKVGDISGSQAMLMNQHY